VKTQSIHRPPLVAARKPLIEWTADSEPRPEEAVGPDLSHQFFRSERLVAGQATPSLIRQACCWRLWHSG